MATILNDGTYIYSPRQVEEHFTSLGYDWNELTEQFGEAYVENSDQYVNVNNVDSWERIADGYYQNMQAAVNELESVIEILRAGKGGTKAQMANRIAEIISNHLE